DRAPEDAAEPGAEAQPAERRQRDRRGDRRRAPDAGRHHNCAVYLLDGEELSPVTVRGANEDEIGRCKLQLGEGLTGHVALTGKPAVVANARESELCTDITGLDADESLASAPLRYGQ